MKKFALFTSGMVALLVASAASAATCTTNAGAGTWNTAATWSCGHVPVAADSVVITRNITANNATVIDLTINPGITLTGNGVTINITGNFSNNGIITGNARMNVTGAASVISGTGTFAGSRLYTSGAAPTIAAGAVLSFTGNSRIYAGRTANGGNALTSVLTINGTINSTVTTATTNFLRLYANSTVVGSTGVVNAGVSAIAYYNRTATVTNNGTVTANTITQNAATNAWTQGVNSNLTVNARSTVGTLNATATGNTVTFIAPATPIVPSGNTYFNLAGTGITCPNAFLILGTSPCTPPPGAIGVTRSPGSCTNVAGIGAVPWVNPANAQLNDNVNTTAAVANNATTNYLQCVNYGFAIPAGATITGIVVNVKRMATGRRARDAAMRILKTGVIGATDRSLLTNYTAVSTAVAHGGPIDLWGTTWLPADINAANFGAAFAAINANARAGRATSTVSVDHMPITVYYTGGTSVDHFLIRHSGTALTCMPEPVQITACGNAACTAGVAGIVVTPTPGGLPVTTATTAGVATGTVTQTAAGAATLGVISPTPTVGPTQCLNTTTGAASCVMTFNSSGFVVTVSQPLNYPPKTYIAGNGGALSIPATVAALQVSPTNPKTCIPAFAGMTTPINLSIAYTNPFNVGTMAATVTTGAAIAPNTGPVSTAASPYNLVFDANGLAKISLTYPDVGQVTLIASGNAPNGGAMASNSDWFISAPASFGFSGITAGPIKAGANFAATITALNAAGATTPNFGKEAPAQLVTLTSNLVLPTGPANPVLGGNLIAGGSFINGVATVNNLSWGEVGNITLTGTLTSYLGFGLNATGMSGTVGRFIPEHLDSAILQVAGGAPLGCPNASCPNNTLGVSGMVYSGQPFTAQVIARNLAGATTVNYQGTFAQNVNLSAVNVAPPVVGAQLAPLQIAAGAFASGVGNALLTYTLPVYAPLQGGIPTVVPTNFFVRAVDADGVSSLRAAGGSIEGGLTAAYGRVKVANAYGSELLPLTLNAAAQYYSATGWTASLTDNVTTLSIAASYPVVAGGATVGNTPATMTPASGIMTSGQLSIKLGAPGAGKKGVATVAPATTATYLPVLPGTATFGVYQGSNVFIYQREAY